MVLAAVAGQEEMVRSLFKRLAYVGIGEMDSLVLEKRLGCCGRCFTKRWRKGRESFVA